MRFIFADILVDSEQVELTKHAKKINCEPRVFELLVYFCMHPKEAVSREELVEKVWGGRIVSNAAVNRAVSELRKLLEDDPSSPQLIITVSKVGYKLAIQPTLLDSQPITQSQQSSLTTVEYDSAKEFNAHSERKLNYKWFLLVATLVLLLILAYRIIPTVNNIATISVLDRKPITSTMGSAFNPFFHAKSNSLFFLYRSNADAHAQIYMQRSKGSAQAISDDNYYYTDVIYGHDGFIYASRLNNLQQRHCEIVKIDINTRRLTPVLACGKGVISQVVFDGKKRRLIYKSRPSISEPYAVHSFQLDTGRKQQLTHPKQVGNNTGDYHFAISPDNQVLAIVEYNANEADTIKLLNLDTNRLIANAPFISNVYGLIWHSNHQILASNGDGLFEFNTNNLMHEAIEHSDQYGRLAHGADHNSILTERSQTTINIFSFSKSQTERKALTASRGVSFSPTFGNRSNIFAFQTNRKGKEEIYIQKEEQSALSSDFPGNIKYINGMAWSPKDDKLVASINNTLYLYEVSSKSWQKLAENFNQVHHVAFADKSILFSAEVDGRWNIWQFSLADEKVKQVTTKGGYSVQGNTDKLYFTKFNHAGLYQKDLTTGIEKTLIKDFPVAGWQQWQLRDDKIYYLLDKNFKQLDLITGADELLHSFKGRKPKSCTMSYKHDFFACEQVELHTSNIWSFQIAE